MTVLITYVLSCVQLTEVDDPEFEPRLSHDHYLKHLLALQWLFSQNCGCQFATSQIESVLYQPWKFSTRVLSFYLKVMFYMVARHCLELAIPIEYRKLSVKLNLTCLLHLLPSACNKNHPGQVEQTPSLAACSISTTQTGRSCASSFEVFVQSFLHQP